MNIKTILINKTTQIILKRSLRNGNKYNSVGNWVKRDQVRSLLGVSEYSLCLNAL